MASRSYSTPALVLKRKKVGETDNIVFLLAQKYGRFVAVAKGVRKLNSSKRAFMEPGNIIKAHLIKTRSLPLLTQAKLISDTGDIRTDLARIRRLVQILEIFDKLFVEQELDYRLHKLVLGIREDIIQERTGNATIQKKLNQLILGLGFPAADMSRYDSILDYVSEIADRPMRSFEYLQVP